MRKTALEREDEKWWVVCGSYLVNFFVFPVPISLLAARSQAEEMQCTIEGLEKELESLRCLVHVSTCVYCSRWRLSTAVVSGLVVLISL